MAGTGKRKKTKKKKGKVRFVCSAAATPSFSRVMFVHVVWMCVHD